MHTGFFDGSSNPNPGELGLGSVIFKGDNHEIDWAIGYKEYGTNNVAEYMSAIMLLKRAISLGITDLRCFGDSKLVINQINGVWACNAKDLKPLHERIKTLSTEFNSLTFEWIRRDKNTRADELSKEGVIKKAFLCADTSNTQKAQPIVSSTPSVNDKANDNSANMKVINRQAISVKQLNSNTLLIVDNHHTAVLNTSSLACTCGEYHARGGCKHTRLFAASTNNETIAASA